MGKTYSCTIPNCGGIFSKAYELKKHKAAHDDPSSVYNCTQCNFFTLQRKNLVIHVAKHTGEKIHHCPQMVNSIGSAGSPASEERCEYKTNDPAALTRHRKKVHDYIPPPNRCRRSKAAPAAPRKPRKPRQKQDGNVAQRRRPYQRPAPVLSRKPAHVSRLANPASSGAGYTSTSAQSQEDSCPFLWGNASDMSGSLTLVVPDEEIDVTTLYDPSLHSGWMAKYEMGYTMPDVTGVRYLPEPLHAAFPSPASHDLQTGREACLCPEWMVEAGIEGWDQSVLETHKELYVLDA
ncbi:hypothetical protein J3R82DRAFT_2011 [Butyriboletus roseoflavus]|nr:hypothetical protein J3R82DRAFT_2011 [Butyriboletus roseoflavus]